MMNAKTTSLFLILIWFSFGCQNQKSESEEVQSPKVVVNTKSRDAQLMKRTMSISALPDTRNYDSYSLDVDGDDIADKVFVRKDYENDSLYIFSTKDLSTPTLATRGFSEDGMFVTDSVYGLKSAKGNLVVLHQYFNGSGGSERNFYLQQDSSTKAWSIVMFTSQSTLSSNPKFRIIEQCSTQTKIALNDSINLDDISFPDLPKRKCTKRKEVY